MGEKIRTTIYLTEELRTKMFTERAVTGRTVTDIIIKAVEKYYKEQEGKNMGRQLEAWDLGEESLMIVRTDEGKETVEWHWADGSKEHVEYIPLPLAAREFEGMDRRGLAKLIREYQSRED